MYKITTFDKIKLLLSISGSTLLDDIIISRAIFKRLFNKIYVPSRNLTVSVGGCKYLCRENTYDLDMVLFHEEQFKHLFDVGHGVFIDVGAHIGKHTIYSAMCGAKQVIAVEAALDNYLLLKHNLKLNNLYNVQPVHAACWDKNEKLDLYFDPVGIGSVISSVSEKPETVNGVTLDSLAVDLTRVDMIKIDVEGAEANVLNGSKNILERFQPNIVFEAVTDEQYNDVMAVLLPFGYSTIKISGGDYLAEVSG